MVLAKSVSLMAGFRSAFTLVSKPPCCGVSEDAGVTPSVDECVIDGETEGGFSCPERDVLSFCTFVPGLLVDVSR